MDYKENNQYHRLISQFNKVDQKHLQLRVQHKIVH